MQQELLAILKRVAAEVPPAEPVEPIEIVAVRTDGKSSLRREDIYGDDGR